LSKSAEFTARGVGDIEMDLRATWNPGGKLESAILAAKRRREKILQRPPRPASSGVRSERSSPARSERSARSSPARSEHSVRSESSYKKDREEERRAASMEAAYEAAEVKYRAQKELEEREEREEREREEKQEKEEEVAWDRDRWLPKKDDAWAEEKVKVPPRRRDYNNRSLGDSAETDRIAKILGFGGRGDEDTL